MQFLRLAAVSAFVLLTFLVVPSPAPSGTSTQRPSWSIRYAAAVPHAVVTQLARYRKHPNAWILHLRPSVFEMPGVKDITERLAA